MKNRFAVLEQKKDLIPRKHSAWQHATVTPIGDQLTHSEETYHNTIGPQLGHDFSQLPVSTASSIPSFSACPISPRRCSFGGMCHTCPIQKKLEISEPGDEYEREADRVAEQVTRMVPPDEEEDKEEHCLQSSCSQTMQRNATDTNAPAEIPPIVDEVLRSPGQPLDTTTRASMEPRLGCDFSQVRVHTDIRASESARALNALAYTVGHDMVFDTGQYAPEMVKGKRLLAHELTHVMQQRNPHVMRQAAPGIRVAATGKITYQKSKPLKEVLDNAGSDEPDITARARDEVASTADGRDLIDYLLTHGIDIAVHFVAKADDIPDESGTPLGRCDPDGPRKYKVYVVAARTGASWRTTPGGSSDLEQPLVLQPQADIAGTLFHEFLHAWFMERYPEEGTGHTGKVEPTLETPWGKKYDEKEFDDRFLDRLKRFDIQQAELRRKSRERQLPRATKPTKPDVVLQRMPAQRAQKLFRQVRRPERSSAKEASKTADGCMDTTDFGFERKRTILQKAAKAALKVLNDALNGKSSPVVSTLMQNFFVYDDIIRRKKVFDVLEKARGVAGNVSTGAVAMVCGLEAPKCVRPWRAYTLPAVRDKIYICDPVFEDSDEIVGIWTIIHEAVHLAGISQPRGGEDYTDIIGECQDTISSSVDPLNNADSYTGFACCLGGAIPLGTPESPEIRKEE
jgi:hypothetical protein